jgi:hypothetical protein
MRSTLFISAAIVAGVVAAGEAQASEPYMFAAGVDVTDGDYGAVEDTTLVEVWLSGSVTFDRLTVFGHLPYLWVDGPREAVRITPVGGRGGAAANTRSFDPGAAPQSRDESGFGDALAGAEWRLTPQQSNAYVAAEAALTLPFGDEDQGLGTGAVDISLGLNGEQRIGRATMGGYAGYVFVGEDDPIPLSGGGALPGADDYAYAGVRLRVRSDGPYRWGGDLSWNEAVYSDEDDRAELGVMAGYALGDGRWLEGRIYAGLTDASPDFGIGLAFRIYGPR